MIGCLRTRVRKQPIIALYFESEIELKFYNLEAYLLLNVLNIYRVDILIDRSDIGINSKIPEWSSQWSSRGYIAAILEFGKSIAGPRTKLIIEISHSLYIVFNAHFLCHMWHQRIVSRIPYTNCFSTTWSYVIVAWQTFTKTYIP